MKQFDIKAWRKANRARLRVYNRKWRAANRERVRQTDNAWRHAKGDEWKRHKRRYDVRNRKVRNARNRQLYQARKHIPKPIQQRLRDSLRSRIKQAVVNRKAGPKTLAALGCSLAEFIMHIESQFTGSMSWENYGRKGWHLDHIMPCATFDLTKPEHVKRCFHFSNYQPLEAIKNLRKNRNPTTNQFNLL